MKRRLLVGFSIAFLAAVGVFSYLDGAEAHVRITTDVTWSETIRPIFIQKCMPCHHPGGTAPDMVDLTFYGDDTNPGARAWAAAIQDEIATGRMPPWSADERFGEFSNEMTLTDEEIELITAWVEGGGPQGPYQNLPVPEQFQRTDWSFGAPDIIVSMPKGHIVPAEQQFDVATVRVPVELEEDTYVTGYEFLVENPKNIGRITAYIHDPEGRELEPIEVEVQKPYDPLAPEDEAEETRMRPMPKGPHFLGQWTKGEGPVLFPDEAGRLLRKGSTIEMRIDYVRPMWAEDWSEEIRDSSKLGLFIAGPDEEVDLLVESTRVENPDFVIKANKQKQITAEKSFEENVHLIGINPHLGPLATKFRAKLEYPDGLEKVLVWVPEFHQRWTMSYRFEEPIPAPSGTKITLTGWYDNTVDNWDNPNDPPSDVSTGPNWTDERLYAMVDYMLDDHLKTEDVITVPEDAPSGGGMLGGFNPLSPKAGVAPDDTSIEDRTREIVDSLEIPDEPERIRPASNDYHQIQGMMPKPGHFQLFVYDDEMNPLDPRNFTGEIAVEGSASQPLLHHHPGDDYLSAWLAPTFPQEFEATLVLGGEEERFAFRFESLSEPVTAEEAEEAAAAGQAFVQPPQGGWLDTLERTGHQVEATLEERGQLRLYFYDEDMSPVDPRNFRGLAIVADPETGEANGSRTLLRHPKPRAEYLEAKISPELPLTVRTRIWVGDEQEELEFEFEELTEEPWDFGGFGTDATEAKPLILGPHGSPEFYAASNGFHFVEATMPRPGEFRLYFYDEWKNPVDPELFTGGIRAGDDKKELVRFKKKDPFLTAFIQPEFPVTVNANIWITGEQEAFTFSFEDVTIDPAEVVDTAAAHMDHEPLHGGQFFMADNMFHHLEGTMPRPGEFRLYFYDNFKQPIDPRNFAGTAYIEHLNEDTGEVTEEAFEMFHNKPSDMFLTAKVPAEWPVTLYAMVNLGGEMKRFDFAFEKLTVEPPRAQLAAAPQGDAGAAAAAGHSHYRPPLTIPATVPEIFEAIQQREQDLNQRIATGDWNRLYIPAWDMRDLVAALLEKQSGLNVREKGRLRMLIGPVNRAARDIDNVAHTQDPPRIQAKADELFGYIDELEDIFGQKA